jgi:hypothetical protein
LSEPQLQDRRGRHAAAGGTPRRAARFSGRAGSGSFGEAAARNGRDCVLVDSSAQALAVMRRRLAFADPVVRVWPAKRKAR